MADNNSQGKADEVVIIGAGPAGLTAAWELTKRGMTSTVLEGDSVVGGISRTVERDGWRFDIGGHRFFTKVAEVEDVWHEILPDEDFLLRPRLSRIYYQNKFFDYPLRAMNVLKVVGIKESFLCGCSYLGARIKPPKDQTTFEGWVVARFGWRLYRMFFKSYTEKVWGIPTDKLPADWAAQRIKNLSFGKAAINAILPKRNQREITSLIEEFQYPKYGPGMMWEVCAEKVEAAGTKVLMDTMVTKVEHRDGQAVSVTAETEGVENTFDATSVISSMPMSALLRAMDPPPPAEVLAAADALKYRDFITVALVVPDKYSFPDNWIYVHSPDVIVGRVQNFRNWSPYMVKPGYTCLGLEYFVNVGDRLWEMPDNELVKLGASELAHIGLVDADAVERGYVVRTPKAYPVYDGTYEANVLTMRKWLDEHATNVYPVGRNGMHKYNNQDHSMFTAMLSVENILGEHHDTWTVNVEQEYHEESGASKSASSHASGTGRSAPLTG